MNAFGVSEFSPVVTQIALNFPGQSSPVSTSLVGTTVQFSWSLPFSGAAGVPILDYEIQIYNPVTQAYSASIVVTNPVYTLDMSTLVGVSSTY
jgi:hypothetical protein